MRPKSENFYTQWYEIIAEYFMSPTPYKEKKCSWVGAEFPYQCGM